MKPNSTLPALAQLIKPGILLQCDRITNNNQSWSWPFLSILITRADGYWSLECWEKDGVGGAQEPGSEGSEACKEPQGPEIGFQFGTGAEARFPR